MTCICLAHPPAFIHPIRYSEKVTFQTKKLAIMSLQTATILDNCQINCCPTEIWFLYATSVFKLILDWFLLEFNTKTKKILPTTTFYNIFGRTGSNRQNLFKKLQNSEFSVQNLIIFMPFFNLFSSGQVPTLQCTGQSKIESKKVEFTLSALFDFLLLSFLCIHAFQFLMSTTLLRVDYLVKVK